MAISTHAIGVITSSTSSIARNACSSAIGVGVVDASIALGHVGSKTSIANSAVAIHRVATETLQITVLTKLGSSE